MKTNRPSHSKSTPISGLREPALPSLERRMQSIHLRRAVQRTLETRCDNGDTEKLIGSFAPVTVRGDFVPTMAEGYTALIDLVNREGGKSALQTSLPLACDSSSAESQITLAGPPHGMVLRIEVRLVQNQCTNENRNNILTIPIALNRAA